MKRPLAMVLLVLLIIGLLHSMYALSQGRFSEALFMYPLLAVCYVFFFAGKKWKEQTKKDGQEEDHGDDDRPRQ